MKQVAQMKEQFQNQEIRFSEKAQKEFKDILSRYDSKRSALLPTLHLAQNEFGHLSDEVIQYVAHLMELSPAQVLEVVSFYHMFHRKLVGRHHLQFCVTLSCWLNGSHDLIKKTCSRLQIQPGETTLDGQFTVTKVQCLGSCGSAPVVQVNETYYENLTPEKLSELMDQCEKEKI